MNLDVKIFFPPPPTSTMHKISKYNLIESSLEVPLWLYVVQGILDIIIIDFNFNEKKTFQELIMGITLFI